MPHSRRGQHGLTCRDRYRLVTEHGVELAFDDYHRLFRRMNVVRHRSATLQHDVADTERLRALTAIHQRPAVYPRGQLLFGIIVSVDNRHFALIASSVDSGG